MKKIFIILFVIAVGATLGYLFWSGYERPAKSVEVDVRQFEGAMVGLEGDQITLEGFYVDPSSSLPDELLLARKISFRVATSTKFEKTDIIWPTWEEVEKAGGRLSFSLDDLEQTRGEGSLNDLKVTDSRHPGGVHVRAEFPSSIFNSKDLITASYIYYEAMTMPLRGPSSGALENNEEN